MAKKQKNDGVVVEEAVRPDGRIDAYDRNGRVCWKKDGAERVILTTDLRRYGARLYIGQTGWTIPGSSDGYKWVEVRFDSGEQLPILTYSLDRVVPEQAEQIAAAIIAENRNTRFDADPEVAKEYHSQWVKEEYAAFVDTENMLEAGAGAEEVYAYTFPSLRELAELKHASNYPVKIGYTAKQDGGCIERIRSQIAGVAAFPERPSLLLAFRTCNGRALEKVIQQRLRDEKRRITTSLGREWFRSNTAEVLDLCRQFAGSMPRPKQKPLVGASHTWREVFGDSGQAEIVQYPGSAAIGLRIIRDDNDSGKQG